MENVLIIVAAAGVAAVIITWLVAKWIFSQRVRSLTEKLTERDDQIIKLSEENNALGDSLSAARDALSRESADKAGIGARYEESVKNQADLRERIGRGELEMESLGIELSTAREAHVMVKTKYDKLFVDHIETTNEKNRLKDAVEQYRKHEGELNSIVASVTAKYEEALKAIVEQKVFVEESKKTLRESFDALSAAALNRNNEAFLDLAKTALDAHVAEAKGDLEKRQLAIDGLVRPLGESLSKMDEKINSLESKREGAYGQISTLLDQVKISTVALDRETRNLVTALKTSHTRGRYGEIALRRLVEFAGMVDQCDFVEQETTAGDSGRLRPDMIIHLPASRQAVVDSKVPLSAYLKMFETDDIDQQRIHLGQHVQALRLHIKQLSAKAYWDQFKNAPDFVVLFMQIESSFGAALSAWPELIEEALDNRIIVATPTTLITMLKSIGYGWNQLKTIENIEQIRDAAVELYERGAVLVEHVAGIGRSLQSTVSNYNKAVGSLEGSFLPQGKRIQGLSQAYVKKQLQDLVPLEIAVRNVTANTQNVKSDSVLPSPES